MVGTHQNHGTMAMQLADAQRALALMRSDYTVKAHDLDALRWVFKI